MINNMMNNVILPRFGTYQNATVRVTSDEDNRELMSVPCSSVGYFIRSGQDTWLRLTAAQTKIQAEEDKKAVEDLIRMELSVAEEIKMTTTKPPGKLFGRPLSAPRPATHAKLKKTTTKPPGKLSASPVAAPQARPSFVRPGSSTTTRAESTKTMTPSRTKTLTRPMSSPLTKAELKTVTSPRTKLFARPKSSPVTKAELKKTVTAKGSKKFVRALSPTLERLLRHPWTRKKLTKKSGRTVPKANKNPGSAGLVRWRDQWVTFEERKELRRRLHSERNRLAYHSMKFAKMKKIRQPELDARGKKKTGMKRPTKRN